MALDVIWSAFPNPERTRFGQGVVGTLIIPAIPYEHGLRPLKRPFAKAPDDSVLAGEMTDP
jgi:hypothetical protein